MIAVTISDFPHRPDSADGLLCFAATSAGESVSEPAVVYAFAVMCLRLQTQQIHPRQQQKSKGNSLKQYALLGKVNLQVDGKMGKGKLLLEVRMLKLADEQARLRAAVEKEQEEVQGLSDRNYRKFVRNCLRQRIEIIKQVS